MTEGQSTTLKFGVFFQNYGRSVEAPLMALAAKRAEALGFDSIVVSDHLLVPVTPEPLLKDRWLESLTCMTSLLTLTTHIAVGASVLVLPYRHPVLVAKAMATMDVLAGGRVILGVGVGSLEAEAVALGTRFHERGAFADEALQVIKL